MVWCLFDAKPMSDSVKTQFIDEYVRHQLSMG